MKRSQDPEGESFWEKFIRSLYGIKMNTTLDKAIQYTVELCDKAERAIWVVDGRLGRDLWANPKVVEALEAASDRGVDIKVIFGPEMDPENKAIPRLFQQKKLSLYQLKFRPKTEFTLVDGRNVRIEEPEVADLPRRAWVRSNTIMLGRRLELDFKALLVQANVVKETNERP